MRNTIKVFRNSVYFLVTLFLLNGCSSPEGNKTKNETVKEKPLHSTDTVVIKQMQFTPAQLNVKKGDTVVWINNDLVAHDVTSAKNKKLYSDTINVGKSWKWAVTDSVGYFCSIHPSMKGEILVK
ncbi:MAG: plastocyanin/azurin family copper-binding protein [Ginsengibacter sp.]|jgi:plastocyanin